MFNKEDLLLFEEKGISLKRLEEQLKSFKEGFPFLNINMSATIGKGILSLSKSEEDAFLKKWDEYLGGSHVVYKFVPASGAASRMFKNMFAFLDGENDEPTSDFEKNFFCNISKFAFYDALNAACLKNEGKDISELIENKNYKAIVSNMLLEKGLNYGKLPKGLILFHVNKGIPRKAVVEHLVEGALYAKNFSNESNVHFTVSPEHLDFFKKEIDSVIQDVEKEYKVKFNVSFSTQKVSTDTIAVSPDNEPFRIDGKLLFRPGGHGALIENLNDIDSDIVFIKNIDNVVPDYMKDITVRYKKLIAGVLITYQSQIFDYLSQLTTGRYTHDQLIDMVYFLHHQLCTRFDETKELEDSELALYLIRKFNRPIRVCGMVRNEGEPGGGPFWAYNQDESYSLQILESSQIDLSDAKNKAMFEGGTHFNPVDLVCAIKDFKGNKFNLPDFVDKTTGFISNKSKNGKDLKALELPGLWNGAMSDWSTIFVEVPLATFNPVKTVNDLLRPEHQPNKL